MKNVKDVIEILDKVNASDISVYYFEQTSPLYDYFIVATLSQRQAEAAILHIQKEYKSEIKRVEGKNSKGWVLIDLGDIVVHLFDADSREFYGFDRRLVNLKVTL